MRSTLVLVFVLGWIRSVHAMGSDRLAALLAWNRDGSAALIENTSSRDGDTGLGYTIVAAAKPRFDVAISQTTREAGKNIEQLTVRDCRVSARRLAAALAASHFDGITVDTKCAVARENVVAVPAAVIGAAERSWVAFAQGRWPTTRETASWQAAFAVDPGYVPFRTDEACRDSHTTLDVANATGKLIVVFASWTCNSPIRVNVHAFEPGETGPVEQP